MDNNLIFDLKLKEIFINLPSECIKIFPLYYNLEKKILYVGGESQGLEVFRQLYVHQFPNILFENIPVKLSQWLRFMDHEEHQKPTCLESILERCLSFPMCSDLHFFPHKDHVLIKIRCGSGLVDLYSVSHDLYSRIIYFIKRVSNLDVFNTTVPQSGMSNWYFQRKKIFIRSSFHPCFFGEKVAMRFLNAINKINTLEQLGMNNEQAAKLRTMCSYPGLFITAGATGSGKTTTVYTILKELSKLKKNIITIEDPVEYILENVCQTNADHLSYSEAIKSALRQDVDVIFVGEIRDEETAKYTVRAAMTGHLVITTMHLKSADQAVNRLMEFGISKNFIDHHLNGVMVQKLVDHNSKKLPELEMWTNKTTDNKLLGNE